MNFSEMIKTHLQETGMNLSQLASAMGYSVQYISDLLLGKKRWNEDTIAKACEALELKIQIERKGA